MEMRALARALLVASLPAVPALASASSLELPRQVDLASAAPVPIAYRGTAGVVTFAASNATISTPRREPGAWHAMLSPSAGRIPRVAIVAALDGTGRVLAWGSVPMHGNATLIARSKPQATVRLRVADREYGPATADARGEASFDVKVPPGVRTAHASAEDLLGATVETEVPIDPPPFSRLLALCGPEGALTVLVTGTAGGPAAPGALEVRASTGTIGSAREVSAGRWSATFDGTEAAADEAVLTASIPGEPASEASCTMPVAPELPHDVGVTLAADEVLARGSRSIPVTVTLKYRGRRTAASVQPVVEADLGTVTGLRAPDGRHFEAVWTLPDALQGRREATLRVDAGGVTRSARIALRPPPRTLSLAVHGGWSSNLARVSAPRTALEVSTRPALLDGRLAAGLEAGWLPVRSRLRAGGERVDASVTAIPVLARASVDVWRGPVDVAAGAAAGAMIARTTTRSATTGRAESVQPFFTGGAFASASRTLGGGSAGLEVWWRTAPIDTPTLDGELGGVGAEIFYRWELR